MDDHEALCQLALWERQARVRKLQKELADCYWEDATVTTSWSSGSAAAYLSGGNGGQRAEASGDEVIINRSVAPIVHYNGGDRAYVELPTESNHWIRVNGEEAVWTSDMRLLYRCEKRNGVWKIADMTSVFEMDKLTPVIPGTDLHIDPEDLKGLRRSYLWLSYVRKRAGGIVSNDLLGIDRPEELQKIYERDEAWIRTADQKTRSRDDGMVVKSGPQTAAKEPRRNKE